MGPSYLSFSGEQNDQGHAWSQSIFQFKKQIVNYKIMCYCIAFVVVDLRLIRVIVIASR